MRCQVPNFDNDDQPIPCLGRAQRIVVDADGKILECCNLCFGESEGALEAFNEGG